MGKRKKQAKILRIFRKVHRTTGALLFIFFFFISVSGLILGWKKNSNGYILPKTQQGTTAELKKWLPVDSLHTIALNTINNEVPNTSFKVDRIDMRKEKGSVKFLFVDSFYEVQLDGANGNVLSIGKRRSDFMENIHDASIVDDYLGTNGYIKLVYTSVMGISLLIFTITGFWLWYGPKRMRKVNKA
ncbi:PepSY domain-containing protein [Flagellimonas halotolerans]|uniref:PepSY domain-containing protein n=1 Tax=Flagellimonas halotolerans TaxID=3112164 RepID=A0ABU6IPV6_9FLAO|nr:MULTISPECIES: PepSY domain-containing protein [unclassified Allomuricauda]MEC3965086.1 PepSY domain-containing protein [Muricauda sp. SYSU M86414]MEC4265069.1 PepSY domain-containing protein [Muricauda sp. SYSU M84420]